MQKERRLIYFFKVIGMNTLLIVILYMVSYFVFCGLDKIENNVNIFFTLLLFFILGMPIYIINVCATIKYIANSLGQIKDLLKNMKYEDFDEYFIKYSLAYLLLGLTDDLDIIENKRLSVNDTKNGKSSNNIVLEDANNKQNFIIQQSETELLKPENKMKSCMIIGEATDYCDNSILDREKVGLIEKNSPTKGIFVWEKINDFKKETGLEGELIVLSYEKSRLSAIGRKDLASLVRHVANEGDGHGYDISSFEKNGDVRLIEVKTSKVFNNHFYFTKNELKILKENNGKYFVYVVDLSKDQSPPLILSSEEILSCKIEPINFITKRK